MDKLIIFNVWWAMASFCEIDWKKIIIDLWLGQNFSPTNDFLLNYAKHQNWEKSQTDWQTEKYHIDQLIISHPHKDHLSDIKSFSEYFYPWLVTTPNDNEWMGKEESLNWELVFWNNTPDNDVIFFKDNFISWRNPPLKSVVKGLEIYYIKPPIIEQSIWTTNYTNNTSLICSVQIWINRILLTWDIMKCWMEWMLNNRIVNIIPESKTETTFNNAIKKTSILVAPHHWLESAYNINAMKLMKDNLSLIIIPEKKSYADSNRNIHPSYYNWDYWSGINILQIDNNQTSFSQSTVKTSTWHIIIKWNDVMKVNDSDLLIPTFA